MRFKISKKAQLYGLSIFIYSLAIALVLIIGLIGLSREIEIHSYAGLQRQQAMSLVKNSEIIRVLLEQERAYAVDRALFYTGAFGGYTPGDFLDINFICGTREVNIDYLGEKEVPYWRSIEGCNPPSQNKIIEMFKNYAGGFFAAPRRDVFQAVRQAANLKEFNYILYTDEQFNNKLFRGIVETRWSPSSLQSLYFSIPSRNPDVEYEVPLYSHVVQETRFYELYTFSKNFVQNDGFGKSVQANPRTSIPVTAIDDRQTVVKQENDGTIYSCKCTESKYDSTGDGTADATLKSWQDCQENQDYCLTNEKPFKLLVDYVMENTDRYPTTPNDCDNFDLDSVSNTYSGSCTVNVLRNEETTLEVTGFSGDCTGNSNDDKAIKCVMSRTINRLDRWVKNVINKRNNIQHKYEIFEFSLSFDGSDQPSTSFEVYVDDDLPVGGCGELVCGSEDEECCPGEVCGEGLFCDDGTCVSANCGVIDWESIDVVLGSENIISVAHGDTENAKWILVSDNMLARRSLNGLDWEGVAGTGFDDSKVQRSVYYGNNKWMIVGNDGRVSNSSGGYFWDSYINDYLEPAATSVIYANGKWVAVGFNGTASWSQTGNEGDWNEIEVLDGSSFFEEKVIYSVAYGDGKWLVSGEKGRFAISSDLSSWDVYYTLESVFKDGHIRSVSYADGRWVLVGYSRDGTTTVGKIYSSEDGINWEERLSSSNLILLDVSHGDCGWIAVGQGPGEDTFYSIDGITWNSMDVGLGGSIVRSSAYGEGRWVVVGYEGKAATGLDPAYNG